MIIQVIGQCTAVQLQLIKRYSEAHTQHPDGRRVRIGMKSCSNPHFRCYNKKGDLANVFFSFPFTFFLSLTYAFFFSWVPSLSSKRSAQKGGKEGKKKREPIPVKKYKRKGGYGANQQKRLQRMRGCEFHIPSLFFPCHWAPPNPAW